MTAVHDAHRATQTPWEVLVLDPVLDVTGAPRLREQLLDALAAGHANLVLDLSGVEFIDSTGLGVLVGALKRVRMQHGLLRLAGATRDVAKVLRITGLDKVFPQYEDVAAALAAPAAD